MLNRFLNILFPESCPVCEGRSSNHYIAPICHSCWESIKPYNGSSCLKCGKPLTSDYSITCGDCIKNEPSYNQARSYGLYEGVLKKALNLLKYYGITRLSKPLSDMMLGISLPVVDVILPVPLHKKRLREREFNHSALIAKYISNSLKKPLLPDCLIKIRETKPQVGLNARERIRNLRKAFEVKNRHLIKEKNVLLIDDVITTGATVRECSGVLKSSGVKNIYVATLAHGVQD